MITQGAKNGLFERLMQDIAKTSPIQPWIELKEDSTASEDPDMVLTRDYSRLGVFVDEQAEVEVQLERVASVVQDWLVEVLASEYISSVWPECPEHRNRHPLFPKIVEDRATWVCPQLGTVISIIGRLQAIA